MRKSTTVTRDRTKYVFEGSMYGKSNLVLAVVKKYASLHPKVTSDKLEELFPRVIKPVSKAKARPERFFLGKEDIINVHPKPMAVSNQWKIDTIGHFLEIARKELNFKIRQRHAA